MRTAIQLCFVCAMVAVCRGQGYFDLSNIGRGPIFGPDTNDVHLQQWGNPPDAFPPGNQIYTGPRLTGTNYSVDATYSLEPVTADFELREDFLQIPVSPRRFSGIFPGFFFGGDVTLPAPNFYVYTQVRAWDNAGGLYPTWTAAWTAAQNGSGRSVGWSQVFGQQLVRGDIGAPFPTLVNLESFNTFIFVPEPATIWLIALGSAFWLIGKRRSNTVVARIRPRP